MPSKRSARRNSKALSIIIGFFFILLLIVFLLLGVLTVFKPSLKHKNIVFVPKEINGGEGQILFAEIFPKKNELNIIRLNGKIEFTVIGGFGKYKLESVFKLLKMEKKDKFFINAAFSNFFQKGVDEVIEYDGDKKIDSKISLLKLFLKNKAIFNYAFFIKDLENDQLIFSQVNTIEDWQKKVAQQSNLKINETCTVAIVNTTTKAGLAGDLAGVLENSGVEVVRVTNNSWGNVETNLYLGDLDSCPLVKNRVQSVSPVKLKQVVNTDKISQYRASMVLFIGDEVAQFFED